jgi:hypothetical protein
VHAHRRGTTAATGPGPASDTTSRSSSGSRSRSGEENLSPRISWDYLAGIER